MSRSLNKVMLIGNLGADPEIRTTSNGGTVANFSIACTETWKDKDGQKQERTEWVRCVAWRSIVEIIQRFVKKGEKVYIEGRLQTRDFTDKDGQKRYVTEVIVDELVLLGGNSRGGQAGYSGQPSSPAAADFQGDFRSSTRPAVADDDLPFS